MQGKFPLKPAILIALAVAACAPANYNPNDPAYRLLDEGRFTEASNALAAELAKDPHNPYLELNLAAAYQDLGQLDRAAPLYRRAIIDGRDIVPPVASDPYERGMTISDIACTNLRKALHDNFTC
jgi:tetratricopeptide (TPR) repeat protein